MEGARHESEVAGDGDEEDDVKGANANIAKAEEDGEAPGHAYDPAQYHAFVPLASPGVIDREWRAVWQAGWRCRLVW
jgi:hypothetical protein